MPRTDRHTVARLLEDFDRVPVAVTMPARGDELLRLVDGAGPGAFVLDSADGTGEFARYSFAGLDPHLVLSFRDRSVTRRHPASGASVVESCRDPLGTVDAEVRRYSVAPLADIPTPFSGGAVGYVGYEVAGHYERVPVPATDPLGLPDAWFGIYETVAVLDRATGDLHLITHTSARDDADTAWAHALHRLSTLRDRISHATLPPLPPPPPATALADTAALTRSGFGDAFERCMEYVHAGDIFQVQISRRFAAPMASDPLLLLRALRETNPSPYMFYVRTDDGAVVGASPEMLIRVEGDRIDYHPIAGTRRRGRTPDEDRAMEQELHDDPKEQAEHLMLVDLGRNDVGRVAVTGSVRVTEYAAIHRYSQVMHLESSIEARLDPRYTALDALRAAFPVGTVTGAPKLRAMEIIAECEPERRGVYAGAVGYAAFNGNLDTAIAIRTVVVRDRTASLQAAAGIVADSILEQELHEIDNKLRAIATAVARVS